MKKKFIILFLLASFFQNCQNSTNNKTTKGESFITEREYQILKDRNAHPNDWKIIDESYLAAIKNPYESDKKTCIPVSISDLKELFYSNSRHKWLTDKGFYLINIPGKTSFGQTHLDVLPTSDLFYAGCRITASGSDFNNFFRNKFAIRQEPRSALSYTIRAKDSAVKEKIYNKLSNSFNGLFEHVPEGLEGIYGRKFEVFIDKDIYIIVLDESNGYENVSIQILDKSKMWN